MDFHLALSEQNVRNPLLCTEATCSLGQILPIRTEIENGNLLNSQPGKLFAFFAETALPAWLLNPRQKRSYTKHGPIQSDIQCSN